MTRLGGAYDAVYGGSPPERETEYVPCPECGRDDESPDCRLAALSRAAEAARRELAAVLAVLPNAIATGALDRITEAVGHAASAHSRLGEAIKAAWAPTAWMPRRGCER
jgi:hypothetical protein